MDRARTAAPGLLALLALAGLVPLTLAVRPAAASKPVDDFEVGAFSVQTNGGSVEYDVEIGTPHVHVLSDVRTVILEPHFGSAAASLDPGSTFDDAAIVDLTGNGTCRFLYAWGTPIDITQNGANDRIVVELDAGVVGGEVTVGLLSESIAEGETRTLTSAGPQTVVFPFSGFVVADPEEALSITVRFDPPPNADAHYVVADIRLTADTYQAVNLKGDFVAVQTPPIPTPPLRFRIFDLADDRLFRVDAAILDVHDESDLVPAVRGTWEETAGLGGEIAGIFFERAGIEPQPFLETTFRMGIEPTPFGGGIVQLGFPPDPVVGDHSFLLEFPIDVYDAAGSPIGSSSTQLIGDVHPGQNLKFGAVAVVPSEGGLAGGPISGFELTFTLVPTGDVPADALLVDLTWIAEWARADGSTGVEIGAITPAAEPIRLLAAPSVTRAETTLQASRPFAHGSTIEILDVGGRTIRRLSAPEGSRAVGWNGRDDSGAALSSGVYFARIAGAPSPAVRIVKVQ